MTLETCKKRLAIAQKAENKSEIAIWTARVAMKSPQEEAKPDGKKPKR